MRLERCRRAYEFAHRTRDRSPFTYMRVRDPILKAGPQPEARESTRKDTSSKGPASEGSQRTQLGKRNDACAARAAQLAQRDHSDGRPK